MTYHSGQVFLSTLLWPQCTFDSIVDTVLSNWTVPQSADSAREENQNKLSLLTIAPKNPQKTRVSAILIVLEIRDASRRNAEGGSVKSAL